VNFLSLINRSCHLEEVEYLKIVIINVLYYSLVTVMAAELVHSARSENGEPERLRLDLFVSRKGHVKIVVHCMERVDMVFCKSYKYHMFLATDRLKVFMLCQTSQSRCINHFLQ
jgi:hypothetical protein